MPRGQAGRRGPWLCPICQTPEWRGQKCPQSPPALPAGQSSAAGCPRHPSSHLGGSFVSARATKQLPHTTGPRSFKRDKIKPFAITQVELGSFYWLCYSISSRGMQLRMEPRWLSPVGEAPMFLSVLPFNLFSFVIFCGDEIQTLPDWALLMDQIASPMSSVDYYTDLTTKIVTRRHNRRTFLPVLMSHWYLLSPSQPYHKTISTINIFTGILCGVAANINTASAF